MQRRGVLLGTLALVLAAACGGSKATAKKPARACPYKRPAGSRSRGGASYGGGSR